MTFKVKFDPLYFIWKQTRRAPVVLPTFRMLSSSKKTESLKLEDLFIVFSRNLKTWKFLLWSVISFFCFEAKE